MASDDSSTPSFWHPDNRKYDMNSRIMITAIISLSVVVILVSLLHIYARCVLRRQAQRRAALRQLRILATAHYQYGEQQPSRGLDPSIIASLPKFIIKRDGDPKEVETGETTKTECSVCLSPLEDGEIARKLPNCGHIFHSECIDTWFNSQSTCPICRKEAEPRPGSLAVRPELREGAVGVPIIPIPPSAPPSECGANFEGTSGTGGSARINGSSSFRLSSFRSILSWERDRSSKRIQHTGIGQEGCSDDLERQ